MLVSGIEVANFFERCWFAVNLRDAPAFWEWARAMPHYLNKSVSIQQPLQSKEQTQLTHTIQELRTRLRQPEVMRDATTRATYQRLLKRLEAHLAKLTNGAVPPPRDSVAEWAHPNRPQTGTPRARRYRHQCNKLA